MELIEVTNLVCPLDGLPLTRRDNQYACPDKHSFDIARQGYVNLLPVQHKASKNPGDNKDMVLARKTFLELAYYDKIAHTLLQLIEGWLDNNPGDSVCILDAGCGEGYYLNYVLERLSTSHRQGQLASIGLDISKPAIQTAAKRNRQTGWMVASNKNIPVASQTVDMVLCLFGFPDYQAFHRVLKPGGKLFLIDAGPMHLIELREMIYPEIKPSADFSMDELNKAGFTIESQGEVKYRIELDSSDKIMHLLGMTPHLYRAPKAGLDVARQLTELAVTVHVEYRVLAL